MAEPAPEEATPVAPDVTLAALYKSARPPVELIPGVNLSAIVNATWLPKPAKVGTLSILQHSFSFALFSHQPCYS